MQLPDYGAINFVGRKAQLQELDKLLGNNQRVAITAIAGMGGIGKTELALQYALQYQDKYPGGICWLKAREESIATQIIEFGNIKLTKEEDLIDKIEDFWRNWGEKKLLIVLDDVPSYKKAYYQEKINPYLPPIQDKFKVLITSRQRPPRSSFQILDLEVLSPEAALQLLAALAGGERIVCDLQTPKDYPSELCQWLGYLPLGLELVGRYLDLHPGFSIEKTLGRLEKRKLKAKALLDPEQVGMTAQLGVATAFDLSWEKLSTEAQELGRYLSLFSSEAFYWSWVENGFCNSEDEEEKEEQIEELEELRDGELLNLNLLMFDRDDRYQLHALIAQYFRAKLEEKEQAAELKQKFCAVMIAIAQSIPQNPNLEEIQAVAIAIPHLSLVATELTEYIDDDDLPWSYTSLGRFYRGQGLYNQAKQWYEQCLNSCQERLGEDHLYVATSLNNLAALYSSQGRYTEAEPLYLQALELYKRLLGSDHPSVASSLNNLAGLYRSQGRYEDAEPLYLQALELRKRLLAEDHPDVASSLNNLAELYQSQGKYEDAEPLYLQALELYKRLLGEDHPDVATNLNNLAALYQSQGRYEDAEPLYQQALAIAESVLGENHPNTKTFRDNFTYCMMMKFLQMPEAEMRQVLPEEVCEQLLQLKQQMESES